MGNHILGTLWSVPCKEAVLFLEGLIGGSHCNSQEANFPGQQTVSWLTVSLALITGLSMDLLYVKWWSHQQKCAARPPVNTGSPSPGQPRSIPFWTWPEHLFTPHTNTRVRHFKQILSFFRFVLRLHYQQPSQIRTPILMIFMAILRCIK